MKAITIPWIPELANENKIPGTWEYQVWLRNITEWQGNEEANKGTCNTISYEDWKELLENNLTLGEFYPQTCEIDYSNSILGTWINETSDETYGCALPYYVKSEKEKENAATNEFTVSRLSDGFGMYPYDVIITYRILLVTRGMANYYGLSQSLSDDLKSNSNFTFDIPLDKFSNVKCVCF